ncbi:MAG: FAD-dependent oxidoreductase [Pseudomonadota bacterium]
MATPKSAPQSPDVIVVGGGVFGLATALACQARGLQVHLFEAAKIGAGASGGIVGALSPHVPDQWNAKKAFQFRALIRAQDYWQGIEARAELPTGYGRTGRLMPLMDTHGVEIAHARASFAKTHWEGRASWQVLEGGDMPPWLSGPFPGVVHETLSARLMPHMAVAAMAQALRRGGAVIHEGAPVTDIAEGAVAGPWGRAVAGAVVLAHGVAGLDWLSATLGRTAGAPVKGQAALLHAPGFDGRPLVFSDGLYVIAHGGGQVAIGSTSEVRFETWAETDALLNDLLGRARALFPELDDALVLARWAGLRPKAKRRDPLLGLVPGFERVFVANGAFKIGFGLAPEVGEVLADLVMGRPVDLPESFTPAWHLA